MEAACINRAIHTLLPVYLCYFLGLVFFFHSFLSWSLEDALSSFPLPLLFLSHTSFILVSLSEIRDAVSSASTKKYENIMGCFFCCYYYFYPDSLACQTVALLSSQWFRFFAHKPSCDPGGACCAGPELRSGLFVCHKHFRWFPTTITFLAFSLK